MATRAGGSGEGPHPGGDVVIIVAVGDRATDHQQPDLGQRVGDAAHIARIVDGGQMLRQERQAELAETRISNGRYGHGSESG